MGLVWVDLRVGVDRQECGLLTFEMENALIIFGRLLGLLTSTINTNNKPTIKALRESRRDW